MNPMPQFAISLQVAIFIGAVVGFMTYHILLRKKIEEAFQKGATFGLKEGFEVGFPQGVVLSIRNLREELGKIGIVVDKDVKVGETSPGLYKIMTFVEVTRPGQDSIMEKSPDEIRAGLTSIEGGRQ